MKSARSVFPFFLWCFWTLNAVSEVGVFRRWIADLLIDPARSAPSFLQYFQNPLDFMTILNDPTFWINQSNILLFCNVPTVDRESFGRPRAKFEPRKSSRLTGGGWKRTVLKLSNLSPKCEVWAQVGIKALGRWWARVCNWKLGSEGWNEFENWNCSLRSVLCQPVLEAVWL